MTITAQTKFSVMQSRIGFLDYSMVEDHGEQLNNVPVCQKTRVHITNRFLVAVCQILINSTDGNSLNEKKAFIVFTLADLISVLRKLKYIHTYIH